MQESGQRLFSTEFMRNPRDFWGGVAIVVVAAFVFWTTAELPGIRGGLFGPGTAPRLFAGVFMLLGLTVAAIGVWGAPSKLDPYHFRGLFFVTVATLCFAFSIRPLGLLLATFASFMIAACGSPAQPWKTTIVVGIGITAACGIVFPYVLSLPFQLFPVVLLR
jgi:putative tricarboxylic transport membrane protein